MQGYNVMFPMGFDAFGLPTENYAIKNKMHPRIVTDKNIAHFIELRIFFIINILNSTQSDIPRKP